MRSAQVCGYAMVAIAIAFASPTRSAAQTPVVGQRAPDLDLEQLGGGRVRLGQFRGRPVLLNFWATWCTPCEKELPDIVSAYQRHRESRLEVLAVNMSDQERMRNVRRFVAKLQLPFPVLLDTRGRTRRRYALHGLPTTVMIDSAGVVRAIYRGPLTPEMLRTGLDKILINP